MQEKVSIEDHGGGWPPGPKCLNWRFREPAGKCQARKILREGEIFSHLPRKPESFRSAPLTPPRALPPGKNHTKTRHNLMNFITDFEGGENYFLKLNKRNILFFDPHFSRVRLGKFSGCCGLWNYRLSLGGDALICWLKLYGRSLVEVPGGIFLGEGGGPEQPKCQNLEND